MSLGMAGNEKEPKHRAEKNRNAVAGPGFLTCVPHCHCQPFLGRIYGRCPSRYSTEVQFPGTGNNNDWEANTLWSNQHLFDRMDADFVTLPSKHNADVRVRHLHLATFFPRLQFPYSARLGKEVSR